MTRHLSTSRWLGVFTAIAVSAVSASARAQEAVVSTTAIPITTIAGSADMFDCANSCAAPCRSLIVPNMFGDYTGNRPLALTIAGPGTPGTAPTTRQISGFLRAFDPNNAPINAIFAANLAPAPSSAILNGTYVPPLSYLGQAITAVPTFTAANVIDNTVFPVTAALLDNPITTADVQALFALPGETAVFNNGSQAIQVIRNQYNIFLVYDFVTPGTPGTPGANLLVAMPNPVDGGLLGRTKISTGNNPLPRDRVIFDYDFLGSTPVSPQGHDINRISAGFEKTFFCGAASLEVRAPFGWTVDPIANDGIIGGNTTQFGNVHLTLKARLFANDWMAAAAGVGVSLPTADDTALQIAGVDQVRIENETTLLTPFAALLVTPNDRLFAQAWFQYGYDVSGNSVLVANPAGGMVGIGRLTDPELMQWDAQVGYWIVKSDDECSWLRGLAPFVELHYNTTTTDWDTVSAGALTVADTLNSYNELNISTGATAQINDNLLITAGVTLPLRDGNDRFGDYQVGVRLNWLFGKVNHQPGTPIAGY